MNAVFRVVYWQYISMKWLLVPDTEGDSIKSVHILNELVKLIKTLDFITFD